MDNKAVYLFPKLLEVVNRFIFSNLSDDIGLVLIESKFLTLIDKTGEGFMNCS